MNKRTLNICKKDVLAMGQEGSIADYKERLKKHCFECYNFITCQEAKNYLINITKQQNNLIYIQNNIK